MKSIEDIINAYFQNFLEEILQNIELKSFITSKNDLKNILNLLNNEIYELLNMNDNEIIDYFADIGETIYDKYKISLYFLINSIEKLHEEILYANHHNIIQIDEDKINFKIKMLIQGLSKGTIKASAKEKLNYSFNKTNLNLEIDITKISKWYNQLLLYLSNNFTNPPELLYENTEIFEWVNSFDFKLLMKATSIEIESDILILIDYIFNYVKESKLYINENDFRSAYIYLTIVEEKINLLNDILKQCAIKFLEDKQSYFFEFFSDLIMLNKNLNYFLTLSVSKTNSPTKKEDVKRIMSNIFNTLKEKSKQYKFQLTGIFDDASALHFLFQYEKKDDIKTIMEEIKNEIEKINKQELILNIPKLIIRSVQTEEFSGLDAYILQKLAFEMANYHKNKDFYHFSKEESKKLLKHTLDKTKFLQAIKNAILNKTIKLFFQPIVHIQNNKKELAYCEILSRLPNQNKIYDAEDFIHYVIEQNLTSELDILVYNKLSEKAQEISKILKGISVNIFPTSLLDENVLDALKKALKTFRQYQTKFILEITEYTFFNYYSILKELKKEFPNTLEIAVDDFGSGYSSLATLVKLSQENLLNAIKIDGSLTINILKDDISFEIVKAAITLAKKLKARTIVEFVENKKTEEKLKEITDDVYIQGYLYSKAIPLEELKNFKI